MAAPNEPSGSAFRKPRPVRVKRSELNVLVEMLQATDTSLVKFGQEVSRHPVVLKQLLRAANSSLTGSSVEISEPAHAALFLGARRVEFLLNTLPAEIIEEDADVPDRGDSSPGTVNPG